MNNDIIKILNLEEYNVDNSSIELKKEPGFFEIHFSINLNNQICPRCGSFTQTIHSYRNKKIKHY